MNDITTRPKRETGKSTEELDLTTILEEFLNDTNSKLKILHYKSEQQILVKLKKADTVLYTAAEIAHIRGKEIHETLNTYHDEDRHLEWKTNSSEKHNIENALSEILNNLDLIEQGVDNDIFPHLTQLAREKTQARATNLVSYLLEAGIHLGPIYDNDTISKYYLERCIENLEENIPKRVDELCEDRELLKKVLNKKHPKINDFDEFLT